MTYLAIIAGLVLLGLGADLFVRGVVSLARVAGLSPLLVGLTLVVFGTSTPELVTSVSAALDQSPGIALGNVIGSNIANIVLGVAALIAPLRIDPRSFRRDASWLTGCTIVVVAVVLAGGIGRLAGVLMAAAVIANVLDAGRLDSRSGSVSYRFAHRMGDAAVAWPSRLLPAAAIAAAGIAGTILGAHLLVEGSIGLRQLSVPEIVIGLTIVVVGTSLPEYDDQSARRKAPAAGDRL